VRSWARLPITVKAAVIGSTLAGACTLIAAAITIYPDLRAMRHASAAPPVEIRRVRTHAMAAISTIVDGRPIVIVPTRCWRYRTYGLGDLRTISSYGAEHLDARLEFLIVSSIDTIVEEITVVLDAFSPPVDPADIGEATIFTPGGGVGPGPVPINDLGVILIGPSFERETKSRAYHLTPVFAVQCDADLVLTEPGRYEFHIEVDAYAPARGEIHVQSATLSHEWLYLDDLSSVRFYTSPIGWPLHVEPCE